MGLSEAGIIDPMSGEEDDSIGTFLETVVSIAFLGAGGHLLLIALLAKTYHGFPMGAAPDTAALANGLVTTGSIMLLMGLKLAAPVLAAFLILAVVLAILARVLPEINVLFESFPLRVGLGLLMTAALLPGMNSFVSDLASWMNKLVT
jgi:flagellar biosynthetic protein FliR